MSVVFFSNVVADDHDELIKKLKATDNFKKQVQLVTSYIDQVKTQRDNLSKKKEDNAKLRYYISLYRYLNYLELTHLKKDECENRFSSFSFRQEPQRGSKLKKPREYTEVLEILNSICD